MFKFIVVLIAMPFLSNCINSEKKNSTVSINQEIEIPQTNLGNSIERGVAVYQDFCMQCHMATGQGVPNTFPPLVGSNWLVDQRKRAIHAVKYGQKGEVLVNDIVYNGIMPPMGLTDEEVADVLNYVMNSWGNTQTEIITPDEVSAVEK